MNNKITYSLGAIGFVVFAYGAYIPAKAEVAQYLIHKAWDEANSTGAHIKPWSWMDSYPVMRLISEQHKQDLIVLAGDTGNVLAFAPGFSHLSTYPGSTGTTLISAHRDTHFKFLQQVKTGDKFELDSIADKEKYSYQVSDIKIIDSNKQGIEMGDAGSESDLKLVTCYPFNATTAGGSLRYVVTANLINNQKEKS